MLDLDPLFDIARSYAKGFVVSTVRLVPPDFNGREYETMVVPSAPDGSFGGQDIFGTRHRTSLEATLGHMSVVCKVLNGEIK